MFPNNVIFLLEMWNKILLLTRGSNQMFEVNDKISWLRDVFLSRQKIYEGAFLYK